MKDNGKYLGDFGCREDVESRFEVNLDASIKILLAIYDINGYNGNAALLYKQGRKLFEVHGAHGSCYGLEGQWEPEEVTKKELLYRLDNGGSFFYGYPGEDDLLREVLK